MSLAEVLGTSASRHGHRPAVTDTATGRSLTYAALAREAERVATFLASQGVGAHHRIGLLAPNETAHLPAAFGLLAAGACLVPIGQNLRPSELDQIVGGVDLNGCLASPRADAPLGAWSDAPALDGGECDGYRFRWIDRSRQAPAGFGALDPAFIRFTSGTTARSKGVVLSHAATLARVEAADAVLRLSPDDRIAWVLPLAYHFAVTIVAYVRAGAHVLMCADTLPGAVVDAIERHHATVLYASPLHLERIAGLRPRGRLDSVRLALSTSAPISAAAIARFEAGAGVPLGQAYGIIEAGLPCINTGHDGLAPTSVGRPVPGYDVALLSDQGERVTDGEGEVGLRGSGLFSAYYSPWTLRSGVERDGWFITGDVGQFDAAGGLRLLGRRKTVIFVGGLKFFPDEVEACIDQFPGVLESRVFARAHPRLGEIPCAQIVPRGPRADVAALRTHCARLLSPWKVPVEFEEVASLPKTPGGKIVRWDARDDTAAPSERGTSE